jgi:uncharacterized protein
MSSMTQPAPVTDDSEHSRFETSLNGELAELTYRRRADRLILIHTGVPADLSGHGIGGLLVRAAVAKAAAEGLTLVPLCPFARSWLEGHPTAADGIAVDWSDSAG